MNIITKDFNPYSQTGTKLKTAYTDLLVDRVSGGQTTFVTYVDSQIGESNNLSFYNPTLNLDVQQIGTITGASQDNPCEITSIRHGLQSNRELFISSVEGMTTLNGNTYTITVTDQNHFTLNGIDSTGYPAYTQNGYWITNDTNVYYNNNANYAWHRVYTGAYGQFLTFQFTYDNTLMNSVLTHITDFELDAMTLYLKPAGKLP